MEFDTQLYDNEPKKHLNHIDKNVLYPPMPDHFIQAMMPLITCMAEEYWKPVLEPASPEEIATVEAFLKDYEKIPQVLSLWKVYNNEDPKPAQG